ncbi:MAG TPA: HDOD domain-containing protein [Spirochaetota bacterium]|nr:HDOD domain-containing protein [Spirochaetota bacterium]HPF07118.1 HDOD domain-containing protein [Spirochaetota bacterium]HPJ42129.1 HDOD domain-containing protein [Spirochaetota bacterium]HPR38492.1 HDOD domain-containing protein [Spirochaetota bacterium]HRX47539.1 HDOD domain-containing protein [Spirochaetota bacterium]
METPDFFTKPSDYTQAIASGDDFYIQFKRFTADTDSHILKIIHRYLEHYDLLFHKDTIISIVREMINNAIKANLKRVYFEKKELDINNIKSYREGMEQFKDEVFQTTENEYLNSLNSSKYVVRVNFSVRNETLILSIMNNAPILESELNKIKARVSKAFKYQDISEAFNDVLDDSEGAGLGLIMAMMLLKSSGFPKESFTISRNDNLTSVNLSIPCNIGNTELQFRVAEEIMKEIEEIPALPDNIKEIRALCRNPESDIKTIASSISRDPGLTASIIKLSNSAGYVTMNRIETIDEAVKIIGMKGINTLLIATGVQKVVESRYKRFEAIWNDSNKRAFYAQALIKRIQENSRLADQVYLSALLADIGKIVMLSMHSDLLEKIKAIRGFKGIEDSTLLEEISLGISHSSLGALICKRWNFNESLIKTIELHRRPHRAPEDLKSLIYTVYLATVFIEIENNKSRFEIIDDEVLEFFKLTKKDDFEKLHNTLIENYSPSNSGKNGKK